jgi:hypothetical protein
LSALIYYLMGGGHESGLQLILQHEITAGRGGRKEIGEGRRGALQIWASNEKINFSLEYKY